MTEDGDGAELLSRDTEIQRQLEEDRLLADYGRGVMNFLAASTGRPVQPQLEALLRAEGPPPGDSRH